jgi:hypothetical protein
LRRHQDDAAPALAQKLDVIDEFVRVFGRDFKIDGISFSNEKRGHSRENEQHAPQVRHVAAGSMGRVDKTVT